MPDAFDALDAVGPAPCKHCRHEMSEHDDVTDECLVLGCDSCPGYEADIARDELEDEMDAVDQERELRRPRRSKGHK